MDLTPRESLRILAPKNRKYKIAFIAPACFFYQVPIFRELSAHTRIELVVYFCSDEAMDGRDVVKKFKTAGRWGGEEELLKGYCNKTLRNYSPYPSYLYWPLGLLNFGIWNEIKRGRPDAVVLMSWTNPTWWLAILACLWFRIPFLFMTDTNVQRDLANPWWKKLIKNLALGQILFRFAAGFLCSGKANEDLYGFYGVPDNKLVPFAFSWELKDYLAVSKETMPLKTQLRAEMGIPEEAFVILYCGRLSKEKGPVHLLEAYQRVSLPNKSLMFVGDGPLRGTLEHYVARHGLTSVRFAGFQAREDVPKYYAMSDLLVLPSLQEATGAVVNEAMCFELPVIVSDQVGFGKEFVIPGQNGFIFPVGDVDALAEYIETLMELPEEQRSSMKSTSLNLIEKLAQRDLAGNLVQYLDSIYFPTLGQSSNA